MAEKLWIVRLLGDQPAPAGGGEPFEQGRSLALGKMPGRSEQSLGQSSGTQPVQQLGTIAKLGDQPAATGPASCK
jgi:hypothetical protein